jgi:hypothetical protein
MMCGADGSYLALTYRQIDALRTAASGGQPAPKPRNETAWQMHQQLHHRATGNPVSSTPCTAVGNCTPGLEVDFRAVWRRLFEGIVLREWDNLVVGMDEDFEQLHIPNLTGHRLMAVLVADPRPGGNDEDKVLHMMSPMIGPSPADPETRTTVLATKLNPTGMAPLEWSNGLATVLRDYGGRNRAITCLFTEAPVWESRPEMTGRYLPQNLKVRRFFEEGTAVISPRLAEPGELTQGLCSPWQNDYRECSCYYWASARPDYVNVEPSSSGSSRGDNWLQKERTGEYVPDDYEDARLITYDDLFRDWETLITFPIAGKDARKPK